MRSLLMSMPLLSPGLGVRGRDESHMVSRRPRRGTEDAPAWDLGPCRRRRVQVSVGGAASHRGKGPPMTIATDRDLDVQALVSAELEWTPDVDCTGIVVAVEHGAVVLSGEVDSYAERLAARRAALRVRGVRAGVDNLTVHPRSPWPVTEAGIAQRVERSLRETSDVPEAVTAEIHARTVTLVGEVDWDFQRHAAQRAVQYLRGVGTVHNLISLTARVPAPGTQEQIRTAITRNAQLDVTRIRVLVSGSRVTLTGTVTSWSQRAQAGHAAWASPHVVEVDNQIIVRTY